LSAEDEFIRIKEQVLARLLESLRTAKTQRSNMANEITNIEEALKHVEDVKNYKTKFRDLEIMISAYISDAESEAPIPANIDKSEKFKSIRSDLYVYKHAYVATL
jgi:hypothetical protein